MDLLENCSECYDFDLSEFPTSIIIEGNLSPRTTYFAKITDGFNNSFNVECSPTDMEGTITIPCASFPAGWFNRNAGSFKIEVSLLESPWGRVDFAFDSSGYMPFYPCIWVDFVNDNSNNNIIT